MLTLYYHPLSSFCWKALTALYEADVAFTPKLVDLSDAAERAEFLALWPIGKFPVVRDDARGETIPESTVIIEHLARHHAGARALVPSDAELASQVRARDRFLDLYVHIPMQKIVTDKLRPAGANDAFGVEHARQTVRTAYGLLDGWMRDRQWAVGSDFTMADCAAAPALFYADKVEPCAAHPNVVAYLERLRARPSFARVLAEAQPYFAMFPG